MTEIYSNPTTDDLIRIGEQYDRAYDRWMRRRFNHSEDGITFARLRLLLILQDGGPQRMSDLAKSAEIAARTVTSLVDGLEREGLARRVPHATDRRATLVEITNAGRAAAENRSEAYWRAKSFLFDALSAIERRQLFSLIVHLLEIIRADLSDPPSGTGARSDD